MVEATPRLAWTGFALELARLLRDRRVGGPLYLVGGAVRDAYLRGAITDIDIAVDGDAIALARRVADWLDADVYVMDRQRGVARVLHGWQGERICLDFAQLRGASLEEDLRDRDFTMNAMAAELLGEMDVLIDPLGGVADLRRKTLRRCSPKAISDDPIRALRAVRMSAQFALKIHPETAADIRAAAGSLRQCSGERIRDEFFKLLGLERAARALRVLHHLALLQVILPGSAPHPNDAEWPRRFQVVERLSVMLSAISSRRTDNTAAAFDMGMLVIQLDRFRAPLQAHLEGEYGGARLHSQLLILAALLPDARELDLSGLKLSGREARCLELLAEHAPRFAGQSDWGRLGQHRFWHGLGAQGIDVILLALAGYLAGQGMALEQERWLEQVDRATQLLDVYFNRYDEIVDPPLLLDGREIQAALDLRPGPLLGELLRELREAQAAGQVESRRDAIDFLRTQLEKRG